MVKKSDTTAIHDLLSGKAKGIGPTLSRLALRLLEPVYSLGANWKNRSFDHKPGKAQRVNAQVISVGNLTTGGTGKTPTIAWLVNWYQSQDISVGIVSRGYKAKRGELNDEGKELKLLFPDVPHFQDKDRVAAARKMVAIHQPQVILLDDGFQHRRLHRDLDIVLIDATNPFGYNHLLPRGLLREPIDSLQRADVILLTRCDQVDQNRIAQINKRIMQAAGDSIVVHAQVHPTHLISLDGTTHPVISLKNKSIDAFCGIGNPSAFQESLIQIGCRLESFMAFADHQDYDDSLVGKIRNVSDPIRPLVCTLKDLVKIRELDIDGLRPQALCISMEIVHGLDKIHKILQQASDRKPK